jgi:hypothetical protein
LKKDIQPELGCSPTISSHLNQLLDLADYILVD